jgi:hypothetical protein
VDRAGSTHSRSKMMNTSIKFLIDFGNGQNQFQFFSDNN